MTLVRLFNQIKTAIILVLSWIIFSISFFVPKNEKIWIFVGWYKNKERETFVDNSKYVFLNVANNHKNIEAVWIGSDKKISSILKNRGYKSYNIHSFRGIWYSLRAKYTIIDAVMKLENWRYSGGSKTIQLWHADGIKNLTFTHKWSKKNIYQMLSSPNLLKKFYFLIASSPYIAENFTSPSFDVPLEKIKITGLPRYDAFFDNAKGYDIDLHTQLKKQLENIENKNIEKIILYGPTFRRGKESTSPITQFDLEKMNAFLLKKNYFLFISLHPKFSATEWIPKKSFSNIIFTNAGYDIYPLLPKFDLLITDYSSICLEFLLLNKPVIFFVYDFEEYRKNPGIPEDFWNTVPGPRIHTFDELLVTMENTDHKTDEKKRIEARKILFTFKEGNSAENVTQAILKKKY